MAAVKGSTVANLSTSIRTATSVRLSERSVEAEGQDVGFSGAHPTAHVEDRLQEHAAVPT
jgi:hypothetical protein